MPQQDALEVIAGADLDATYQAVDVTGSYPDWTVGTWEVEMQIRDQSGQLLATLANFGTPDGTITLALGGLLVLHLPGAITAELPITRPYTNSTDQRINLRRHRGAHAFDLIATETVSNDVSDLLQGTLTVLQPVTV